MLPINDILLIQNGITMIVIPKKIYKTFGHQRKRIRNNLTNFTVIQSYISRTSFVVSWKIHNDSMNRPNNNFNIILRQRVKLWLLARKNIQRPPPPLLSLSSAVSRKWSTGKIRDHSPHHLSPLCTTFHLLLTAVHLLIRHRRSTQFPPPLE